MTGVFRFRYGAVPVGIDRIEDFRMIAVRDLVACELVERQLAVSVQVEFIERWRTSPLPIPSTRPP